MQINNDVLNSIFIQLPESRLIYTIGLFYHGFFRSIFCPYDAIYAILFYRQRPGISHSPKRSIVHCSAGNR